MSRTLALVVPDWLAVAAAIEADLPPTAPVAVLRAGRLVSATAQARALGVERGMRARAARRLCPDLSLFPADPEREARHFASVTEVLTGAVARFTVLGAGAVGVPAESLRYAHADEAAAVEVLLESLTQDSGWEFLPGIADTVPAALLAAQRSHRVEPGGTPAFLAELPVSALEVLRVLDETVEEEELLALISVFVRLGLRTLGDLAALTGEDVSTRFGELGLRCRRLACGEETPAPPEHLRTVELCAAAALDPPTPRTDVLAFRARTAAAELFAAVRSRGLVCTQVTVRLQTPAGEENTRTWRLEEMEEARIADRVRWQAEGWRANVRRPGSRTQGPGGRAEGDGVDGDAAAVDEGIALLTLIAAELAAPLAAPRPLFGEGSGDDAVTHSLERLQGLFGPDAVRVPVLQGGRDPEETDLWTPWQQRPQPLRDPAAAWPGAVPRPHPTRVLRTPVELLDARGRDVVARPSGLDSAPELLRIPGVGARRVVGHSEVWAAEIAWPEPVERRYLSRLQVLCEDGSAYLLAREHGRWRLRGEYA
ncbi:DNA polymerase Y family protein [Brevibacterium salitolerans]|uniref:DNA polymerase Y family protein n=1 Tax=Brevibacterium salitolerans TaxID=1403566 RepID=A0ABP5I159_9MICO